MIKRAWHPNFIKYMDEIVNHPNYANLPIAQKYDGSYTWLAPKNTEIGQQRMVWALEKAEELGIANEPGVFAKVMYAVHPTKQKVCQICGNTMSIQYIYPATSFVRYLTKNFGYCYDTFHTIYDINIYLKKIGLQDKEIKLLYIKKLKFSMDKLDLSLSELMILVERHCRNGFAKLTSPGAMSNFPDRYDGFHSYNKCCRSTQDKGRSPENLRTYTKDRRAYEYWSDGNIHAANKFMTSSFFTGTSADHIGPISLGFIHDPRFIQSMLSTDNSAKRDRLTLEDFYKLIDLENTYNICPVSWFSREIWNKMKKHENIDLGMYREIDRKSVV